jgi:hypothetical protein
MNIEPSTQGDPCQKGGGSIDPIEPFLNALAALLVWPGMCPQRPQTLPKCPITTPSCGSNRRP